ncbi:hypothetical protein Taro_026998 [Colocasia esculenta]|uniref:GST C-terminal domain-containing protein n=1 Tax=Colocasia esculenta TaxID=4460 RepID=A0A843VGT5_COLES|nr:hypothetical protein [Colocasia esculenta]
MSKLKVYADRGSEPSRAIIIFCNHAILRYLACSSPGIADHWYPADVFAQAKINSVLDWHHSNLRRGGVALIRNSVLARAIGVPPNPEAAAEGEKLLSSSLSQIESFWLEGNSKFLCGLSRPSIADLSLVCQIMQLEFLNEEDRERILGPHEKVLQWIKNLKDETNPHFEEVHEVLAKVRALLQQMGSSTELASEL